MWLANVPIPHRLEFGEILIPALWLVGGILLAALILAMLRKWGQPPGQRMDSPHDQLAHFRALYERGEMSMEEYQRIHARLAERIRAQQSPPAAQEKPGQGPKPDDSVDGTPPGQKT